MGWRITTAPQVGHWVAHQLGRGYFAEGSCSIGLERDGKLVAGVIYQDWNPRSIVCHLAVGGRLTPQYLAAISDYAFNVCRVGKVIAPIESTNKDCIRFVTKFGFTEEARIVDSVSDGDTVIYTVTREACRYLGERYGKKLALATPAA